MYEKQLSYIALSTFLNQYLLLILLLLILYICVRETVLRQAVRPLLRKKAA